MNQTIISMIIKQNNKLQMLLKARRDENEREKRLKAQLAELDEKRQNIRPMGW